MNSRLWLRLGIKQVFFNFLVVAGENVPAVGGTSKGNVRTLPPVVSVAVECFTFTVCY